MCRLGESSNRIVSGRTQPARISFVRKERADKRRLEKEYRTGTTIGVTGKQERRLCPSPENTMPPPPRLGTLLAERRLRE